MLENYTAGVVDIVNIAHYFGVTPESFSQQYRHIIGILPEGNNKAFLKLSTAEGAINHHTQNEIEVIKRRQRGECPLPVATPTLKKEGVYDNQGKRLIWFTTDYIANSEEIYPFNPEDEVSSELFERHLSTVIDTAIAIMDWEQEPPMPLDVPRGEVAGEIIKKVDSWIEARLAEPKVIIGGKEEETIKAQQLRERFFADEKGLSDFLDVGPSHGDFVPNNFRITPDGQLYLMDLENTRCNWMKFYDAAYMYHRLYTKYQKPELAKAFLKEFVPKYSQSHTFGEREVQNFKIALAQRLIGGYFDATQDEVTSWQLQDELSSKLLESAESLEELL